MKDSYSLNTLQTKRMTQFGTKSTQTVYHPPSVLGADVQTPAFFLREKKKKKMSVFQQIYQDSKHRQHGDQRCQMLTLSSTDFWTNQLMNQLAADTTQCHHCELSCHFFSLTNKPVCHTDHDCSTTTAVSLFWYGLHDNTHPLILTLCHYQCWRSWLWQNLQEADRR